jgi:hypothetical protein
MSNKSRDAHMAALALISGVSDGEAVYRLLRPIEKAASKMAVKYSNGEITEKAYDRSVDRMMEEIKIVVPVEGIFINSDPRGYALKVDDQVMRDKGYRLERDMGGYGLLAPDFS